ncbi:AraC family transcriptional regulator [Paenibacillus amylolyticus]|uniref:AraC family transcriptional regulator n=1 Tax=Paenibacillus amylolyticus TaxID=1451 RepID=UPI003EBE2D41
MDNVRLRWIGLEVYTFHSDIEHAMFASNHVTLWMINEGEGVAVVDGQQLPIVPGSSIMILPGTVIEWVHQPRQIVHAYKLEFEANWEEEATEHPLIMIANRLVSVQPVAELMELLEQMVELKKTNIGLARFKREILLQEAIYQFALKACANQPATTKEAVLRTITHMEANYQRNWKVGDLAAMASVSLRQYSHIFRQITGTSPMDYLHGVRMDQAKRLLRSSSGDMLSVAKQVGFKDEFYFSRRFKQQEGVSPSAYMKKSEPRVIGLLFTSHLLALGITPIGVPDYHVFRNEYIRPYLPEMEPFAWGPCDLEQIRTMKPDLILGYEHMTTGEYEQFSAIAEVVRIPWQSQDVYQQLDSVGAVVNKRMKSIEWMEQHRIKVDHTKECLRSVIGLQETYAALVIEDTGFRVAGNRNMGHVLHRSLRLTPHPLVQQFINDYNGYNVFSNKLPFEELPYYDADRLFIMVNGQNPNAEAAFQRLCRSEIWNSLKAVRNKNLHTVSYDKWWMYTPLAVDGQLDEMVRLLEHNSSVR